MKKCSKLKNNGFTLIEVMVSILILGTTFMAITQAFPYSLSLIMDSECKTKASYLSQDKIEELYKLGYDNIGTGIIEIKHRLNDIDSLLYNYQRQTEVVYVDQDLVSTSTDMGIKKISVDVYYTNKTTGSDNSYNLTTILTKR